MAGKKRRPSAPKYNRNDSRKPVALHGRFAAASGGFGFITPVDNDGVRLPGGDVFIPPQAVGRAIDGDTVEAVVRYPDSSGRIQGRAVSGPVGRIVKVLSRNREFVVAQLNSRRTARPLNRHLPDEIPVNDTPRSVKTGEWVRLRLLNDGGKHTEKLRGSVADALGPAGTVEADLKAIANEYDLQPPYTDADLAAVEKLTPLDIPRRDFTEPFTVTIDPADAHDFDDAVSIEPGGRNELLLGVHIADVAVWIRTGSKFDKMAAKRGFSSYLPGMFLPMLPKPLTAKISLREGVRSNAHTVLFRIRKSDGKILSAERFHSVVKVDARLTYAEVQQVFDDPKKAPAAWKGAFLDHLKLLALCAKRMRDRRSREEKFLNIETSDTRVLCDETTFEIKGIERRVQSDADRLVEEFMLAANSAVAAETIAGHLAGLYRIHPEPDPEKIAEFSDFAERSFKVKTGDILSGRDACRHFLENIPDDHRKPIILSHFLRSLPRASYREEPDLHYGLGKLKYAHFTSPIRRYPDLALHQQLLAADLNTRLRSKKTFAVAAETASRQEENNDNAYFAATDRLKLHYLKQCGALENGTLYEAVIHKITTGGLVCDIPELGLYGFVPVGYIRGGQFRRSRGRDRAGADRSHTEYRVGDFVYLILDSLDLVRGSAIFRPAL